MLLLVHGLRSGAAGEAADADKRGNAREAAAEAAFKGKLDADGRVIVNRPVERMSELELQEMR